MSAVAVCGSIAQRPGRPGHAWAILSWVLGLRKLGHDVLFVDRLDPDCVGRSLSATEAARSAEGSWLTAAMAAVGLVDRHAALLPDEQTLGMPRPKLLGDLRRCELLLDVNGFLRDEELLAAAERRVYLDIDPGFAQIWEAQGLPHGLAGHDDFVTVGTNLGAGSCRVPTGGRRWIKTLPPVPLELWPVAPAGEAFTTVGSWRGPFGPLEHAGATYGLRAHEFRRFVSLPAKVAAPFEVALEIDREDEGDREALEVNSWKLLDPLRELAGFDAYRRFVQRSRAEISIAKGVYVGTRGGWFSDRSACYLASGKPVVAQATGVEGALPTGRGLLCFEDLDGAARAAEEVCGDLQRHCAAARAIAEEHLEAGVVLARLLDRLGVA
jgi:hypothetical protein